MVIEYQPCVRPSARYCACSGQQVEVILGLMAEGHKHILTNGGTPRLKNTNTHIPKQGHRQNPAAKRAGTHKQARITPCTPRHANIPHAINGSSIKSQMKTGSGF